MTDWRKFWETYPRRLNETDFLKQVQRTVGGQPVSDQQFQLIVSDIYELLELKKTDVVLDLCCGNGLITKQVAKFCKEAVGVDFSMPLLEIANRYHRPENVSYQHTSVLDLSKMPMKSPSTFNKVLMYDGLQYFKNTELIAILQNILQLSLKCCTMLFASVPDKGMKWRFYNTTKRRLDYLMRTIKGREAIGTWWDREFIRKTCKQLDLLCEFRQQNKELYTSHYRFNVLIQQINT